MRFLFAGTEDNQVLRFQAGESDIISRVGARNFAVLEKDRERRGYELVTPGASLEYTFLFFNLGEPAAELAADRGAPGLSAPQELPAGGFRRHRPRRHRPPGLPGQGRTALAGPVPPGNKAWINTQLPAPVRSVERARQLLTADGFKWNRDGTLLDPPDGRSSSPS